MKKIELKINELFTLKQEIDKQIKELQHKCKHVGATKTHRSDTGNYDPMDDCYWTEFECKICRKFWSEDGSK